MRRNPKSLAAGAISVCVLALSIGYSQAQTIGQTLQTTNVVLGSQGSQRYARLKSRDSIYRDQYIQTKASSVGQFEFEDGTALVVGPEATIQLNDAVYGGPGSHQLLSGTLRFVTNSVSSDFDTVVTTPVASIGVRGTIFDVFVDAITGTTAVLLVKGGPARVCAAGACKIIANVCDVIEATSGQSAPSDPQPVSTYSSSRSSSEMFPFAARSARTRSLFRAGANSCKLKSGRAWGLGKRDPDNRPSFPEVESTQTTDAVGQDQTNSTAGNSP